MTLNERILLLEKTLANNTSKIVDLSIKVDGKLKIPYSIVGGNPSRDSIAPIDIKAGLGSIKGGSIIWNTSEIGSIPANEEPPVPGKETGGKGYNNHSHSRFSGGALIKDVLEVVDYDLSSIVNPHSQQFWQEQPGIKTSINTEGESVQRIGVMDLVFNPDTKTWGCPAYEIDIERCIFVKRNSDGEIEEDENGNKMSAPLYNTDPTKTSIIWDVNGKCWRIYAVYAPDESQI